MNGQCNRIKPVRSGSFRAGLRPGVPALLAIAFSAAVAQAAPFAYVPVDNVPPGPNTTGGPVFQGYYELVLRTSDRLGRTLTPGLSIE